MLYQLSYGTFCKGFPVFCVAKLVTFFDVTKFF